MQKSSALYAELFCNIRLFCNVKPSNFGVTLQPFLLLSYAVRRMIELRHESPPVSTVHWELRHEPLRMEASHFGVSPEKV